MKAMVWEVSGFVFLPKFTWISMEKPKAGIFHGHQLRELRKEPMFEKTLSGAEPSAWQPLPWKPSECGI